MVTHCGHELMVVLRYVQSVPEMLVAPEGISPHQRIDVYRLDRLTH